MIKKRGEIKKIPNTLSYLFIYLGDKGDDCQIWILQDFRLAPECSAAIEPCPHYHTCGISGWPTRPPCGPDRLYPALPSLQDYLQIYTDPRLHETWTETHRRTKFLIFLQPPHQSGLHIFFFLFWNNTVIQKVLSQNQHTELIKLSSHQV